MLKRVKQATLGAARVGGAFGLVGGSRWRRQRLLILCYHGVSIADEHEWNPELFVSPDHLRRRMERLRTMGCTVLPLADAVRRLYAGDLPPRAVALTFDDGTHDFPARALPILREFGFPATVYLTTYYSGFQRPVFSVAASYLCWEGRGRAFDAEGILPEGGRVEVPRDGWKGVAARVRDAAAARDCSAAEKDALLRLLAERLGVDYQRLVDERMLHIMTPEQVAALPRDLVDVQLHTHRHRTPREHALFLREIADNRTEISRMTGAAPEHFCYPSGAYRPEFLPWLRQAGVVSATTCIPGLATPEAEALLLPRLVDTMRLSTLEFDAWLSGVASFIPRRAGTGRPPEA